MRPSPMPEPELVVFDLGGTTIHDRGEVPAAFAEALRAGGIAFEAAELDAWRGASKRDVVAKLLGRGGPGAAASRVDDVYRIFRRGLTARLTCAGELSLPGIARMIGRLRAARIRVAIATGFDREIVALVLGSVEWGGMLDAQVCSDDVREGRPAPYLIFEAMERCGVRDVRRVAVVGDTRLDLEAGWNAGATYRIGVLTGAHDRATLLAAPHTHVLQSAADVPDLWLETAT